MASFKFKKIYLDKYSTISSLNEKIYSKFTIEDLHLGEKTSEEAEEKMQDIIFNDLAKDEKIDFVIGGDLSNELCTISKTFEGKEVPLLGIYSACATFCEGLIIASSIIHETNFKKGVIMVSSHNLNAEKTYKYPVEYGVVKKHTQTFTLTAAAGVVITKKETNIKLESATIGKIIDSNITDVSNMGAVMAPAAFTTLIDHLNDLKRDIDYYDLIITGDLGLLGTKLFYKLLEENDITSNNHIDAGAMIIKDKKLSKQGGSGPVCLPLFLFDEILENKKYKKILLIATGSLHNKTLTNQKRTIPSIAHAVSLEVLS